MLSLGVDDTIYISLRRVDFFDFLEIPVAKKTNQALNSPPTRIKPTTGETLAQDVGGERSKCGTGSAPGGRRVGQRQTGHVHRQVGRHAFPGLARHRL